MRALPVLILRLAPDVGGAVNGADVLDGGVLLEHRQVVLSDFGIVGPVDVLFAVPGGPGLFLAEEPVAAAEGKLRILRILCDVPDAAGGAGLVGDAADAVGAGERLEQGHAADHSGIRAEHAGGAGTGHADDSFLSS